MVRQRQVRDGQRQVEAGDATWGGRVGDIEGPELGPRFGPAADGPAYVGIAPGQGQVRGAIFGARAGDLLWPGELCQVDDDQAGTAGQVGIGAGEAHVSDTAGLREVADQPWARGVAQAEDGHAVFKDRQVAFPPGSGTGQITRDGERAEGAPVAAQDVLTGGDALALAGQAGVGRGARVDSQELADRCQVGKTARYGQHSTHGRRG